MNQSNPFSSFKAPFIAVLLFAAALGVGCGEPQSSSSTNWLRCHSDADCAVVAGAVCRSDSMCVDSDGRPIPAPVGSSGPTASGGEAGASELDTPAGGAGTDPGAGASSGGLATGMAGSAGLEGCPPGPPAAGTACSPEGLVCDYAGSPVGVVVTCQGGAWVSTGAGADPTFVCPSTLPKTGSNCPKPPTPEYSPLVCMFDCADKICQNDSSGLGCGAHQLDCTQDAQSGEWHWALVDGFSCTI